MKDNQRKVPEMTPLILMIYILVIVAIGLFFFLYEETCLEKYVHVRHVRQ